MNRSTRNWFMGTFFPMVGVVLALGAVVTLCSGLLGFLATHDYYHASVDPADWETTTEEKVPIKGVERQDNYVTIYGEDGKPIHVRSYHYYSIAIDSETDYMIVRKFQTPKTSWGRFAADHDSKTFYEIHLSRIESLR